MHENMPPQPAGECTLGGAKDTTRDACREKANPASVAPDGRHVDVRVADAHGRCMSLRLGKYKAEELAWFLSRSNVSFTIQSGGIRTKFALVFDLKESKLDDGSGGAGEDAPQ